MTDLKENLLARVDSFHDEMLKFLQGLISIPTINPPGENYLECAEYIGSKLREFSYDVRYVPAEGRPEHTSTHPRSNVVGRLGGTSSPNRPLLHFNGHFDVVPVGEGWTVDPLQESFATTKSMVAEPLTKRPALPPLCLPWKQFAARAFNSLAL